MQTYWILPHPGANAVFFDASEGLMGAELMLCLKTLDTPCASSRVEQRAGLRWHVFDAKGALSDNDLARLAQLSALYALFAEEGDLLRPIMTPNDAPFSDSLSGILKYPGKTNALFTRFLLHVAALSLQSPPPGRVRLLDPVAGKGTTLFEGLMRGWDAAGIEIAKQAAHDGAIYFQKYLETEKWKHKLAKEKRYGAPGWAFTFARDKDALKDAPGRLTLINGDAKLAERYFGKACFDIVAGDLPYGVAHGSVGGAGLSRSPAPLLEACLPAWRAVLRPGGVLALSWNTLVYPADSMAALLTRHGFTCLREPPYDALAHRVDASIRRDVVIAVRP
ncbi:MAG: hypothetical protein LBN04_12310 [Oscillospiraceae bacterium]|jgi:SAM-dependent methyltransferase|nr:hypothetical protein [Oscillospiraceae bacterium]